MTFKCSFEGPLCQIEKFFFSQIMWQCGIQSRTIVCGQARRTEPSTLQFTEHLARIFIDQNQFLFEVSYTVSQYRMAYDLITVRQEVNILEGSVAVQEP